MAGSNLLLIVLLSIGMLYGSSGTYAQDAKTIKEQERAEKRAKIKKFFKDHNPFKKHDDDDNSTASSDSKSTEPQPAPQPAPVPAPPAPAPNPSTTKQATASTKKKVKKPVATKKTTTTAQPFM